MTELVLVVEDDADLREFIRLTLVDAGFEVAEAADGAEGLAMVASKRPSLILLDMMMPVLDGWAFAAALARSRDAPPIVVMTAAESVAGRATEIGAAAWLAKPFDLDDLVACVLRHVRRER